MIYYLAKHTGGLKECIESEQHISSKVAQWLIEIGFYKFYAYDERIKANRYLITDLEHLYMFPSWLHEYKNEKDKMYYENQK